MVTIGKRARISEISANPNHQQMNEDDQSHTQKLCGYEQFREQRIKENLERMQKLGILDLSLKLKSTLKPPNPRNNSPTVRKTPQRLSPFPPSEPVRRSSRLHNVTPVSYSEVQLSRKDLSFDKEDALLREGSKPEVYTEEHEKFLGDTNMSWTLFVDGYGKDGKRIYDPIRGKTCHQCRQKTLGHRTQCSNCNKVQGQFCGDCLYMRYGENVLEAKQNPDWICPVCRGICNCSFCRQAKGWPPTGVMYKKISSLGYKSVAHYLIQTQSSKSDSEKDSGTKVPLSAKRSLSFSSVEAASKEKESADHDNYLNESVKMDTVDNIMNEDLEDKKEYGSNVAPQSSPESEKNPLIVTEKLDIENVNLAPESNSDPTGVMSALSIEPCDGHEGFTKLEFEENKNFDELKAKELENMQSLDNGHCDSNVAPKRSAGFKRKTPTCTETMLDCSSSNSPHVGSIAGRLRLRRRA